MDDPVVAPPAERYGKGRPKAGELRPPKMPKVAGRGVGRPSKAEQRARKKMAISAAQEHADRLAARERERVRKDRMLTDLARKQRHELSDAGEMDEEDPLAAASQLCSLLIRTSKLVLQDKSLTPAEQRAELRQIARSVQGLIPSSRILQAETFLRATLDKTKNAAVDVVMTDVAENAAAPLQMAPRADE